jgi:plasmid stabilization system protein ParE
MTGFRVRFTQEAEEDLLRLFDFLIEQDVVAAERADAAIAKAVELLEVFPFSCRKAVGGSGSPFLRELIIPFGGSGYVALFEIEGPRIVTILAVRHQREEDYH